MTKGSIFDAGVTVVYEPKGCTPIVEYVCSLSSCLSACAREEPLTPISIIFVHGLQGHPFKTWACKKGAESSDVSATSSRPRPPAKSKQPSKNILRHFIPRRPKTSSDTKSKGSDAGYDSNSKDKREAGAGAESHGASPSSSVFWPADLLPADCPKARILTWGYDTRITKYMVGAVNKSSIFSHSKDLLFALQRERELDKPIIFVAHSMGGIIVKEAREPKALKA
jgi:protein SERAC1